MNIGWTRSGFLRKALATLWIAAGMGMVAVLGYGGDCTQAGEAVKEVKNENAATGFLLHAVDGNPRLFSCQYRCMASLVSWNVIASSRSCLEYYQALKFREKYKRWPTP